MRRRPVAALALALVLMLAGTPSAHACSGVCDMRPEVGYFVATDVFIGHRVPSQPPVLGQRVPMNRIVVDFQWKGTGRSELTLGPPSMAVAVWDGSYQSPRELIFAHCDAYGRCGTVSAGCADYSQTLGQSTLDQDIAAAWPLVGGGWLMETVFGLAVLIVMGVRTSVSRRRRQQLDVPAWLKVLAGLPVVLLPVWVLIMFNVTRCPAHWYGTGGAAPSCATCAHPIALNAPVGQSMPICSPD